MNACEIADEVARSKKYSNVDRTVLERICAETLPKYVKQKDVIKAVKKTLHMIYESYIPEESHTRAEAYLSSYTGSDIKTDRAFSASIMALHASTNERLGQAAAIYDYICRYVNAEDSIIDIGCGFNPFALPFFTSLPKSYYAFDICSSTIALLNSYFSSANLPYSADICDAVTNTPKVSGNVLFMFKLFPLLEQQKKGRAFDVIRSLDCNTAVVSFPLKSASGRDKGMDAFYSALFEKGLPSGFLITDKTKFINEMFYVITKGNL